MDRRLRGMRVYCCGAMDRVSDGGTGWRNLLTPLLQKMGVVVMDPCNKPYKGLPESPDARKMLNDALRIGDFEKVQDYMRQVRTMDLRMVDVSDFLVVSIDMDVHLCGSWEEVSLANRQKKPIICCVRQGKCEAPNWLFGMIPHQHIFSTWDEVMEYLRYVDEAPYINTYKRWVIPEYDMLYNPAILNPGV